MISSTKMRTSIGRLLSLKFLMCLKIAILPKVPQMYEINKMKPRNAFDGEEKADKSECLKNSSICIGFQKLLFFNNKMLEVLSVHM